MSYTMGQLMRMGEVVVGADEYFNVIITWNKQNTMTVWDVKDFDTYNERYHAHVFSAPMSLAQAIQWAESIQWAD